MDRQPRRVYTVKRRSREVRALSRRTRRLSPGLTRSYQWLPQRRCIHFSHRNTRVHVRALRSLRAYPTSSHMLNRRRIRPYGAHVRRSVYTPADRSQPFRRCSTNLRSGTDQLIILHACYVSDVSSHDRCSPKNSFQIPSKNTSIPTQ